MSKKKEPKNQIAKPLDLVRFYYKLYQDYNKAYNGTVGQTKELENKLKELVKEGNSSDEDFKKVVMDFTRNTSLYTNDITFIANKFLNAADFYIKTNEKDLPAEILKDYITLKDREYKTQYSVEKGEFVKNSESTDVEIPQQEFDIIFNYYKSMIR